MRLKLSLFFSNKIKTDISKKADNRNVIFVEYCKPHFIFGLHLVRIILFYIYIYRIFQLCAKSHKLAEKILSRRLFVQSLKKIKVRFEKAD